MSNSDAFCSSSPSQCHSSRSISCASTPTGNICDSPARIQPVAAINPQGNWRGVGVGDYSRGQNGNRVTTEISNDDTDSTRSVSGRGHHVGLVSSGDGEGGEQLPEPELNSVQNRRPGFTELKPKDEDIVDQVEEQPSAPTSSSASRHPSPSRSAKAAGAIPPPPSTLTLARSSSATTRSFTTSARPSGAVPSTTALTILAGLQQAHREASEGIAVDPTPPESSESEEREVEGPVNSGVTATLTASGIKGQELVSRPGQVERTATTSPLPSGIWGRFYSGLTAAFTKKKEDIHIQGEQPTSLAVPGSLPDRVTEGDAQAPSATAPIPVADWTRSSSIGSIQGLLNSAFDYITTVAAPSRSVSAPIPPIATGTVTTEDGETHSNGYPARVPTSSNLPSLKSRADSRPSPQNPLPLPPPSSSTSSSPPLARSFSLSTRLHVAYQSLVTPAPAPSPSPERASRPNPNQSDLEAVLQGQQRSGATVHRSRTVTSSSGKGGSGSGSGVMRKSKYTDYFRDREDTTSPPPLPIPSSSVTYRSKSPSPQQYGTATSTTTTTTSSRRNTVDSTAAPSFSSFYTSATSVPASSGREFRPRERSDKERDRDRSRARQETYPPARATSPDFYSQANSTFNSAASDPYAVARLEDRCRHLEKGVRDLQAKVKTKDQEIKTKDDELREREVELRAKDSDIRARDNELREKDSQLRQRDGELRGREGALKEVEKVLKEMQEEVRWRDEELEKMKEKERQWEKEKVALQRKPSMKELVHRTKENVEKLENQLKRRATASPVVTAGKRPLHGRRGSLDVNGDSTLGVPEVDPQLSTSAPSAANLVNRYGAAKQRGRDDDSESGSSASSSSVSATTADTHPSPSTSPSPAPPPPPPPPPSKLRSQSQHRSLAIATSKSAALAAPPNLPFTETHAQQRSADAFLTRTDSWSGAQVLQAVNDINSEVVQFAAVVTEMCRFAPREVPSPCPSPTPLPSSSGSTSRQRMEENDVANPLKGTKPYSDTATRLGGALTHLLATYDHSNDPILVQLALQACVCVAGKRAWESFCLGLPAKSDGVLSIIYRSLRELEPQPTASKWRSLTHGHIHTIYPTLAAYSANELAETMLRWTLDILTLAGCVGIDSSSSTPTAPSSNAGDSLASYGLTINTNPSAGIRTQRTTQLILPQLLHITTALTRLENVLRQDILSTSFDLVIPECGMMFGREWMIDYFGKQTMSSTGQGFPVGEGNDASSEVTKVLGSVEVGLMCRTRVGMRGGGGGMTPTNSSGSGSILGGQGTSMSQQQQGGGAVYEERLLLMPKVILESMVDLL